MRIGVVSYCKEIVPIWQGVRERFKAKSNVDFSFTTFDSYEALIKAVLGGEVTIAWNGPVAHVRLQKQPRRVVSLGMRDVDRGFTTYVVGRRNEIIKAVDEAKRAKRTDDLHRVLLEGKRLATGTFDSPQAYIVPMHHLKKRGVEFSSLDVIRFDHDVGKHGDTAMGEEEAMRAVHERRADFAFVSKLYYDRLTSQNAGYREALLPLTSSLGAMPVPSFHHCQFDAMEDTITREQREAFRRGLFGMSWEDEKDRPVMQLEGIRREWVDHEESGYEPVKEALAHETSYFQRGPSAPPDPHHHPFRSLRVVNLD